MNLAQADHLLSVWKERLSAIAENLLEVQCDTTYQSLTGTGGLDKVAVTGRTAARVEPALRAMNPLFSQYGALQATYDRAAGLREKLPSVFGAEARLREIEMLLCEPSLEAEVTEVPLAERDLLTGVRHLQRLCPEELLDRMMRTFRLVRDALHEVGEAWNRSGNRALAAGEKLEALRAQRTLPTEVLAPALDRLDALMEEARKSAVLDPLGAEELLDGRFEGGLSAARQQIVEAETLKDQVRRARLHMDELDRQHAAACLAHKESMATFGARLPAERPVEEPVFGGLRAWLERLEARWQEGLPQGLGVGLRNWEAAAQRCREQDAREIADWQTRQEQCAELQGRFGALRAKARARGVAEVTEIKDREERLRALLAQRPIAFEEIRAAVVAYEQGLSRATRAVPQ